MRTESDNQARVNQAEWERPENWSGWLGTYRSVRDTRLFVPRRVPTRGWALNLAHRASWWTLLGLFTVPLGFLLLFVLVTIARSAE